MQINILWYLNSFWLERLKIIKEDITHYWEEYKDQESIIGEETRDTYLKTFRGDQNERICI